MQNTPFGDSSRPDKSNPQPIPHHWVGIRKDWENQCYSFGEALIDLSPKTLERHAYVLGSTGSGKTNFLHQLIAGDILRGHSLIVLDARGELANSAIELAARAGVAPKRIKFFNLREKVRPLPFNPLVGGGGEPYYRALGILDAIEANSLSWGIGLAETARYVLLLLAEIGGSITHVEPFLF